MPVADIALEARRWNDVADDVRDLDDLQPWDMTDLRNAMRRQATTDGGTVVLSGGTTGAPKLSVIAPDMGVPRLLATWRPLGPGDVLLNLFAMGRMWGAHYYYNTLAAYSSCTVAPVGALHPHEVAEWVPALTELGVTALAGAPNVLARFATAIHDTGADLPVRTVIWSAEPMTPPRAATIRAAFPAAGLWANYGSIETFPIGVNKPDCPLETMHLLPGQLLEPSERGALLTRVGTGWPAPAVRFRLGDRVRPVDCRCGEADAFEVLGRTDDRFKLCGSMLGAADILQRATGVDGVEEAQLVLYRDVTTPTVVTRLCLRYTGAATDPGVVRTGLVGSVARLAAVDRHTPEAVAVERVADVERNPRTNKVLPVLWRDAAPVANMSTEDGAPC